MRIGSHVEHSYSLIVCALTVRSLTSAMQCVRRIVGFACGFGRRPNMGADCAYGPPRYSQGGAISFVFGSSQRVLLLGRSRPTVLYRFRSHLEWRLSDAREWTAPALAIVVRQSGQSGHDCPLPRALPQFRADEARTHMRQAHHWHCPERFGPLALQPASSRTRQADPRRDSRCRRDWLRVSHAPYARDWQAPDRRG